MLLRLLKSHRRTKLIHDHVSQLSRELIPHFGHQLMVSPSHVLRRDSRRRGDSFRWVYEEKYEDLSMAWFGVILEFDGTDAVLVYVGEGKHSSSLMTAVEVE
jgi:hypothetical protein